MAATGTTKEANNKYGKIFFIKKSVLNIQNLTGVNNLYCIGYCVSDETSDMYLFFTDWDGLLGGQNPYYYDPSDNNFIIKYNAQSQNANILVQGAFLNFSKENPIYGVNVLENLLFWTDNRNQPRKINIEKAVSNYCHINNAIDDKCLCWNPKYKDDPKCIEMRKYFENATDYCTPQQFKIEDHPDFSKYIKKDEIPCWGCNLSM